MGRRGMRMARGGPGALEISIEAPRENLPAVLELAAEILRQPAFSGEEFETLRQETLAAREEQMSEPQVLVSNELQRRLNPYPPTNIRYVPTPAEQIERLKALNLADVQALYQGLVGASYAEAAFVGDFEPAAVSKLLDRLFSDWSSPKPFQRIESAYQPATPDTVVISTPDKANAMVTLGLPLEVRDDDPDYPALLMANVVLGAGANSRLVNRIRQQEGLAYSCGSMAMAGSLDRVGTFVAFSICAPQNAERTLACAREEIERFLKDGVPQQELDDARNGYRQQIEVGLANDGAVAGMLARDLFLDRTLAFSQTQLDRIGQLAPHDVQAILAKYIQLPKLVVVRAGDFTQTVGTPAAPSGG